jgi:hypothetical protein
MNAHFIELDIILKVESKPWIVSKSNPNIPLLRMDKSDYGLFSSGVLKSMGNKIKFNGITFWVSDSFMDRLKLICKKTGEDISNLAISQQEFLNGDVISDLKSEVDMNFFKPIMNTNSDIYIICSKNTKSNYDSHLKKLEEEMLKIGLKPKGYYYIRNNFRNVDSDWMSYHKAKLVLQHLVGFRCEGDKFTDTEITSYDQVVFWDDDSKSIKTVSQINEVMENVLIETDEGTKLKIKDIIRSKKPSVTIREWANNKVNKYKETTTFLSYSHLVKSFENWKYRK